LKTSDDKKLPSTQDLLAVMVKQHFFCKIEKRGMKKFEVMG